ncbi:hypothetical protein Tco_0649460 [Tanacetum coccineum]
MMSPSSSVGLGATWMPRGDTWLTRGHHVSKWVLPADVAADMAVLGSGNEAMISADMAEGQYEVVGTRF